MKLAIFLVFATLFSACTAQPVESRKLVDLASKESATETRTPVMVELFTSEGCSSCPPAERVLAKLQLEQPFKKAEIITLALHVDYWDGLGWKDKFASPLYTQRQKVYDRKFRSGRIYTPQMIVDGEKEFVGSNFGKAKKAINASLKREKAKIEVSQSEGKIKIAISKIPKHDTATVYLAFAEDNLSSQVIRGENAGKNLTHVSVVRSLKGLSKLDAGKDSFEMEFPLQVGEDWKEENLNAVVFVQENGTRRILGVARAGLRGEILPN